MDHAVRCAWIKQNDAGHTRYRCGATTAQMILYGRDDTKFQAADPTALRDTREQLRRDQQLIWEAIIHESRTGPLPAGCHYEGVPESDQIIESDGKRWATHPDVLARVMSSGMSITAGPLAGVPARVVSISASNEEQVLPSIVESLDRGVASALLLDGWHWVVVYRYHPVDHDRVEIYYHDGLHEKTGSTFWSSGTFFKEIDTVTGGAFDGRFVIVTAASHVPVVRHAIGLPPIGVRKLTTADATRRRTDVPLSLESTLLAELASDREWAPAFAGARLDRVLEVTDPTPGGTGYYLADFVRDDAATSASPARRTGSVIVDPFDLRRRITIGVSDRGHELPRLLPPGDVERRLARSRYPGLVVDNELVWYPCDQSASPFLPFHVARDPGGSRRIAAYVRADGEVFTSLTQRLAGI